MSRINVYGPLSEEQAQKLVAELIFQKIQFTVLPEGNHYTVSCPNTIRELQPA